MRKTVSLGHLASLGILVCLVTCVGLGLINCCSPRGRPPKRDFDIRDLLIDESAFPPEWNVDAEGPRPPAKAPLGGCKSIERIELFFYVRNGGAVEQIHRFYDERGAAEEFERQLDIAFGVGKYDTPWVAPAELPYQSSVADRFHFACSMQGSIPMCRMIGQYDEYFVRFNTHMSSDFMTYEDLGRILKAIDERMAHYLGKESK